jgi:hypothetical protein
MRGAVADFTGREKLHIAAGLCGWEVRPEEPKEDVLWHSPGRWIRVRYDSMDRIREALDHAQIGTGGPMIEQSLDPGSDRADQIVGWLTRLR